jgi:hypothetical protein
MNLAAASDIRLGSTPANGVYYGSKKLWTRDGWIEPPRVGLVGFWGLNDNNDGSLDRTDTSDANRTLLVEGSAFPSEGKIGGAAEFIANPQYLAAPVPEFLSNQNYAFSMWINVAQFKQFTLVAGSTRPSVVIGGDNSNLRWSMSLSSAQGGWLDVSISNFFELNTWMHCVFSRTSSARMQVFRNNILVYDNPTTEFNEPVPVTKINFGNLLFYGIDTSGNTNFQTTDENFKGKIDALGFWNRALSAAEVAYLWNNGNGREL